jgi:hypothetical protein
MHQALNVNDIIAQARQLDEKDQLNLLERLVVLIRKSKGTEQPAKITSISGLGSSVWSGINIDEYVDQERQW